MPDLTMCKGINCSSKEQCYRYRAHPSMGTQSWFQHSPGTSKGDCEYFVNVEYFAKASLRPVETIK